MKKMLDLDVSFSKYDYFVILIPGVLILIFIVLIVPSQVFVDIGHTIESYGTLQFAFVFIISVGLIIISYVLGLLLSGLGSWLIEDKITSRWLSPPAKNLFQLEKRKPTRLFKKYSHPYSEKFQKQFFEVFDDYFTGIDHDNANDLFRLCYHVVKEKCPNGYNRLGTFISLYGLYKSLILAFIIGIVLSFVNFFQTMNAIILLLPILFALLSIFCFYKFLIYYRIFADEVFSSFFTYRFDLMKSE